MGCKDILITKFVFGRVSFDIIKQFLIKCIGEIPKISRAETPSGQLIVLQNTLSKTKISKKYDI